MRKNANMNCEAQIKAGVPTINDYFAILRDELFERMELFSNQFLTSNESALAPYSRKWVLDPLHNWSRQWEYPFVFSEISKYVKNQTVKQHDIQILDAGSGITFFPFYLASSFQKVTVRCCDTDASLSKIFHNINSSFLQPVRVNADKGDIHHLSYTDNAFDILYCISVLEHTENFETILHEFQRVLKPSGLFIITFDISLDGSADISIEKAEALLRAIKKYFSFQDNTSVDFLTRNPEILTTQYIQQWNKNLLPWKHPILRRLKSLMKFRLSKNGIPNLTVYCETFANAKGRI